MLVAGLVAGIPRLEVTPRAAVADAARDHTAVLRLAVGVDRRQLLHKILAVLDDAILLSFGLPVLKSADRIPPCQRGGERRERS